MKSLKDYVLEAKSTSENENGGQEETVEPKKVFTFDFTDLENSKETIESLQKIGDEKGISVTVEGEKVTFEVNKDAIDKIDPIHELITEYTNTIRHSQKRSSDESYAQKTKTFANVLNDLDDYIDQVKGESENKEKPTEKPTEKPEDKDDEQE